MAGPSGEEAEAATLGEARSYSCPACLEPGMREFATIGDVPVWCNVLRRTEAEAVAVARARMRLGFCKRCGMIYNLAHDASLLDYGDDYENSLHGSPTFRDYAETLAARLIDRYDVRGKDIVEIGCGDGEFLRLLCRMGDNRGVGFDPSHGPGVEGVGDEKVRIVRGSFSDAYSHILRADLLCCRHVLEHVARPREFLATVRLALRGQPGAVTYFEVPNALATFRDGAFWDLIYEHPSYFTPGSAAKLFEAMSFGVLDMHTTYQGQFLGIEASPASGKGSWVADSDSGVADLEAAIAGFADRYRRTVDVWGKLLSAWIGRGKRVVVWGAGSKGVSFLNSVEGAQAIGRVVDINARKQGCYVPCTGQRIVAPEDLLAFRPDVVIVMNPIYEEEIGETLAEVGVAAHVEVVDGPPTVTARSDPG
jgi:SAM-dependent methyltransferase